MKFNSSFYKPNTSVTREMAEDRMKESGYTSFHFRASSYSNGASFYFTLDDGKEVRVSDHKLTGKRAVRTIQIDLFPVKKMKIKKAPVTIGFEERLAKMIASRRK